MMGKKEEENEQNISDCRELRGIYPFYFQMLYSNRGDAFREALRHTVSVYYWCTERHADGRYGLIHTNKLVIYSYSAGFVSRTAGILQKISQGYIICNRCDYDEHNVPEGDGYLSFCLGDRRYAI